MVWNALGHVGYLAGTRQTTLRLSGGIHRVYLRCGGGYLETAVYSRLFSHRGLFCLEFDG